MMMIHDGSGQPVCSTPGPAGSAGYSLGGHGGENGCLQVFPAGLPELCTRIGNSQGVAKSVPFFRWTQLCLVVATNPLPGPDCSPRRCGIAWVLPQVTALVCVNLRSPESQALQKFICSSWWSSWGWSLCSVGWFPLSLPV